MRAIFLIVLTLGACFMTPPASIAQSDSQPPPSGKCPRGANLQEEQKYADFAVRIYRGGDDYFDGCIQILKGNRLVYSKRMQGRLGIGNDINGGDQDPGVRHAPAIPMGTDITGMGKPDLILNQWSGGAHCCFTFYVLELGGHPREIASVQAEDSDYAHFEHLSHGGAYEFVGWDFTFAYWHTSFMESPAPRVILRFNGARYVLALDLMDKSVPSPIQFAKMASDVRTSEWEEGFPPPLLWRDMLDFIYTGHSDLAWQFANSAWISGKPGEAEFLKGFCHQLTSSPYFRQLRPTIQSAPCSFK